MRPTFDPQDNINGIISNGGSAANVIPASADCEFCIRADTMKRIEGLIDVIKLCVRNAEQLTGAKADISWGEISAERYPNRPMCQAFKDNMATCLLYTSQRFHPCSLRHFQEDVWMRELMR